MRRKSPVWCLGGAWLTNGLCLLDLSIDATVDDMHMSLKSTLDQMWTHAYQLNQANILQLLSNLEVANFLDLGCDDGSWTRECAIKLRLPLRSVTGLDIVPERLEVAERRGIGSVLCDLGNIWPLQDDSYDLIHANQVIEHMASVDHFASETWRVLKQRGRAIISTESTSSWCNVGASALGWQMFSLTNVSSSRGSIGNPLALHRNADGGLSSWTHKTLFSFRGLSEFFEAHGFRVLKIQGAGYFPFPSSLGKRWPRNAHFLTLMVEKL